MEMHTATQGCAAAGERFKSDSTACATGVAAAESKSVRLFGVKLSTDYQSSCNLDINNMGMMRKSMSMGNLGLMGSKSMKWHSECVQAHTENMALRPSRAESGLRNIAEHSEAAQQGYASDGLMQTSSMGSRERRKGVPWTEEEHRLFLAGLQRLGKGDWRGISRNFVTSRTPTQVASHAQKYFLRQCNLNKRKRRSSLFDIINSNTVTTSSTMFQEHPNVLANTELNRPVWELGQRHLMGPSSSPMNRLSPFAKPLVPTIPNVSADLCLGRTPCNLQRQQQHVSMDDLLSLHSAHQLGKQTFATDAFLLCNKAIGLDDRRRAELDKPVVTISSSSSSRSLPSSPSSSSLCRIDEASELSSLSLSIAPPMGSSSHSSELALKLEPPTIGIRQQSAVFSPATRVCEHKDMLLIAGA